MPIAFITPISATAVNLESGVIADVDEVVAAADGFVMVSDPNNLGGSDIVRFTMGTLPGSATSINSVILRVRARTIGFDDDTVTYRMRNSGGALGSEFVSFFNTDVVLTNKQVTMTGSPSVADVNGAAIFWSQFSFAQVMGPDGGQCELDCFELEVDYNIAAGFPYHIIKQVRLVWKTLLTM